MAFLTEAANRGSISTGYDIDNSLKFESANVESLTKSQTASNRKTWTVSFWFKRTKMDSALQYVFEAGLSGSTLFSVFINGTTDWRLYEYVSNSRKLAFHSTAPLNDPSAWYHLVMACDTTQSVATDRFKIYLNGVNLTAISGYFSTAQYPTQNYETHINSSASTLSIGKAPTASTNFCGYISEFNFIDGLMKEASDFGKYDSTSGIWQPIEYTGSYGNEGYYLDFESSGSLGADSSGNGNNFTLNNIAAADQAQDSPTNNFCIMSPLWSYATSSTLTNGGTYVSTTTAGWTGAKGSIGIQNGKWYWEVKSTNVGWSLFPAGIQTDGEDNISSGNAHSQNTTMALGTGSTYIKYVSGVESSVSTGGAGMSNNNITGVALDLDSATKTLKWYKNNSLIGTVNIETVSASFGNQPVFPFSSIYADSGTVFIEYNFGGYTTFSISSPASDANGYGTFEYAPPSGYYALCSKNLAEFG